MLLNTIQTRSAKKTMKRKTQHKQTLWYRNLKSLALGLLLGNTALKPRIPGGGEETPTNIEGQPISVRPMRIRSDFGFILRICDIKKKKRELLRPCAYSIPTVDENPAADMTAPTDKWISFRYIQHVVISVRGTNKSDEKHDEGTAPLCFGHISIITMGTYLIRAMSSIRPPFPL